MKKWEYGRSYVNFLGRERRYPALPAELAADLEAVAPVHLRSMTLYPCRLVLRNRPSVDCAYVVDARQYVRGMLQWPDEDRHQEVAILDVARIETSPYRLPVEIARRLYEAGETAMGGLIFEILYRDGTRSAHFAGGCCDFVTPAPGRTIADIEDVSPHTGLRRAPRLDAPDAAWCLFGTGPAGT